MIPLHPPTSCGDSDKPEMWKCTSALFYGAAITPGTKPPALNTWTMRIVQVHTQIKWRRFLVLKLTSDEAGRPTGICLEEVPYCIPEKTVAIWEVDDLGMPVDMTSRGRPRPYYHTKLLEHLSEATSQAIILKNATNDPFRPCFNLMRLLTQKKVLSRSGFDLFRQITQEQAWTFYNTPHPAYYRPSMRISRG
ncbi:hypothetical protein RHS04_05086 [Rhizoctonia solani]|uniref:Uncharacterized protein n=1 Tax=Rhizoctonia solani TaxID=456999 RepID=A0A8H7H6G2_9AGAM|nr:hypothetical protein RHS04_05086 [Rhizoctonia solani]